jgi:chloride channel 7
VVSVTVRVLMKLCKDGSCGFFGSGGFIIFEITEGQDNYEFYELLPMLLLGVVGGLLGSSFNSLNAKLTKWVAQRGGARGPGASSAALGWSR